MHGNRENLKTFTSSNLIKILKFKVLRDFVTRIKDLFLDKTHHGKVYRWYLVIINTQTSLPIGISIGEPGKTHLDVNISSVL